MARVLIVDDDADIRTVVREALQRAGYSVAEASGGAQALKRLGFGPGRGASLPDLVLLDPVMPDIDGLSVVARMRLEARTRELPILLLTGRWDIAPVFGGCPAVRGQVQKPFETEDLLGRIGEALGPRAARRLNGSGGLAAKPPGGKRGRRRGRGYWTSRLSSGRRLPSTMKEYL